MFNPSQFFYVLNATLVVNEQNNVYYDITPGCLLISINNQLIQVNQFSINFITNILYFKYNNILYVSSIQVSEQKDMLTIGNILTTNVSDNIVQTTDSITQLYFKSTNAEQLNPGVKIEFYADDDSNMLFEGVIINCEQDRYKYDESGIVLPIYDITVEVDGKQRQIEAFELGTNCYKL